jgi:hypothetical protein
MTCVYVRAVVIRSSWPTSSPIRAHGIPPRWSRLTRRCLRSCGENEGTPLVVQARAIAVRKRSPPKPWKTGRSESDPRAPPAPSRQETALLAPEPSGRAPSLPRRLRRASAVLARRRRRRRPLARGWTAFEPRRRQASIGALEGVVAAVLAFAQQHSVSENSCRLRLSGAGGSMSLDLHS